jgi:hypothetical protein
MSDYSYERALWMGLLVVNELSSKDKEEFKQEVQKQLGLAPGQDCDTVCGAMDDAEFTKFIEYVKKALRRKKKAKTIEEEQPLYA